MVGLFLNVRGFLSNDSGVFGAGSFHRLHSFFILFELLHAVLNGTCCNLLGKAETRQTNQNTGNDSSVCRHFSLFNISLFIVLTN